MNKNIRFFVFILAALSAALVNTLSAQSPDRSKPPEMGPPPSLKLPLIQHLKLSNGLPVVLMEKHQVPLVEINLVIRAGSALDPNDLSGLASITAAMMEEGAGNRNSLAFADAVDFLGANVSVNAGMHTTTVSLFTPLSKLDSALTLFADAALRPLFPADELERARLERLNTLIGWHDQPRVIASTELNLLLFGKDHPYGPPTMGNEQSIRTVTVPNIKQFYASYVQPNNATLIVVGDVTKANILAKLEALFGSWKPGSLPSAPAWPAAAQVDKRVITLVDKPGAAQSAIRIGRIGVARSSEDYFPLVVMNTVLGGSFTSRLNDNLREKHGYTYGAGSRFNFLPQPGAFIAYADVQTDVTDKALVEFMKELTNIPNISDAELTRAKNYVALSYPSEFQSVGAIAGNLAEMVIYNLPDDYFNTYTQRVLAVTKDDVVRVAKKYIDPSAIRIVVVGDKKKIESGMAELKLGPIEHLTIDDVLGKSPEIEKK